MKFLPQPTPWLLRSQTAICGISGASFFSGFFCLLERVGLVAHVRAATCKCAYPACVSSDWFCRCILDNIQPTGRCHNFEHHPWNQSIFLVEFIWFSCFALPSLSNKTGFCPFFSCFVSRAPDDMSLAICISRKRTVLVPVRSLDCSVIPRCRLTWLIQSYSLYSTEFLGTCIVSKKDSKFWTQTQCINNVDGLRLSLWSFQIPEVV